MENEKFTTVIDDVRDSGLNIFIKAPDIDIDRNNPKMTVYWEIVPQMNDRGIYSVLITVTKITFDMEWYYYIEDLSAKEIETLINAGGREMMSGNIEGSVPIDINRFAQTEWTIKEEFKFAPDGALSPESAEIDFVTKTIIVS